ncbi:MAG: hypothetical protein EXS13_06020 [Planctomycetes bacterium]|nr:hypothetical protein [Planctomycetota bacterium]
MARAKRCGHCSTAASRCTREANGAAVQPFLTCRQIADFIGEYFDATLAPPQRREFERHLAVCPPCIHYLKSYKTTVALTRLAKGEPVEPPTEELIQAILAARRQAAP